MSPGRSVRAANGPQSIVDMVTVKELMDHIVGKATDIIKGFPARYL
jgi:hypothetical protein